MIKEQTVGHHCWRVACIYVELFALPRAEVLYYCLHHDSGELWAGDLPFGTKGQLPPLKSAMTQAEEYGLMRLNIKLPELTMEERSMVKICDLLEMHETGRHELNLGNKYAEPIIHDTLTVALLLAKKIHAEDCIKLWLGGKDDSERDTDRRDPLQDTVRTLGSSE